MLCLIVLPSCGAGSPPPPPQPPPSARAPELAAVVPACDGDTLRGFDPGLDGLQRVAVAQRAAPGAGLARQHARPCEVTDGDEACLVRAQREVMAADPAATLGHASIEGEPDGWMATLDVDGDRREVPLAADRAVVAEVRRLEAAGHRVVPIGGRIVYRASGRRAVVQYAVPVPPSAQPRLRWEAELRWPLPEDLVAALGRVIEEVGRANLEIVRYEVVAGALTAVVGCP